MATIARVPLRFCPTCGMRLKAAAALSSENPPAPGDVTVCTYCVTALRFDERLHVQALSSEEISALEPALAAELRQARTLVLSYRQRKGLS
jgi:hypothetical protein